MKRCKKNTYRRSVNTSFAVTPLGDFLLFAGIEFKLKRSTTDDYYTMLVQRLERQYIRGAHCNDGGIASIGRSKSYCTHMYSLNSSEIGLRTCGLSEKMSWPAPTQKSFAV